MNTVIVGAAGQLGRALCRLCPGPLHALTRSQLDVTQASTLRATLEPLQPDVLINCSAYNLVDRAEDEPGEAFAVNTWAVRELARVSHELGCLFVHVSSDYVFGLDVERTRPYEEHDAPGPVNAYGISKLAGEYVVRRVAPTHLIVRTCGLYGPRGAGGKGGNFVETMLRLAHEGKPIRVVADQLCTPSFTEDIATGILRLIEVKARGVYHVTNGGSCSWYELARTLFELERLPVALSAIPSSEYPTRAARPRYSVLAPNAYLAQSNHPLRSWQDALQAYLRQRRDANDSGLSGGPR